jgi:hypothetical protein
MNNKQVSEPNTTNSKLKNQGSADLSTFHHPDIQWDDGLIRGSPTTQNS